MAKKTKLLFNILQYIEYMLNTGIKSLRCICRAAKSRKIMTVSQVNWDIIASAV